MTRLEALDLGFTFDWEDEAFPDLSWCECEGGKPGKPRHNHTVLSLVMHDPSGRAVDAIGNITDPSPDDSREFEEEMAQGYTPPAPRWPQSSMMIETHFVGPTDHRGARVVAHNVGWRKDRKTVAWDHSLGIDENHLAAALALAKIIGRFSHPTHTSAVDGGGRIFVFGEVLW